MFLRIRKSTNKTTQTQNKQSPEQMRNKKRLWKAFWESIVSSSSMKVMPYRQHLWLPSQLFSGWWPLSIAHRWDLFPASDQLTVWLVTDFLVFSADGGENRTGWSGSPPNHMDQHSRPYEVGSCLTEVKWIGDNHQQVKVIDLLKPHFQEEIKFLPQKTALMLLGTPWIQQTEA